MGGASTGTGGLTGPTIEVHVLVENPVTTPGTPIEDVELCVLDLPVECAHTDAEGRATLIVPANARIWATLVKDGYMSALVGSVTSDMDLELTAPFIPRALAEIVAESADVVLDITKGHVILAAVTYPTPPKTNYPPVAGVSFSLEPPPASGPHYVDMTNFVDPALTATGERGGGVTFNSEPGMALLTASHPTLPCQAFIAQPGMQPNTYDVRILADFVTYVTIVCGEMMQGAGGGGNGGMAGAGGIGGIGGAAAGTGGTAGNGGN